MRTLPTMAVTMPMRDDHCCKTSPGSPGDCVAVAVAAVDVVMLAAGRVAAVVNDHGKAPVTVSIEAARASWPADAVAESFRGQAEDC